MGLIKKAITYGLIFAIGIGTGTGITKCKMERNYDLIPKDALEKKVEREIEYIKPRVESDYKFIMNDYGK